MLLQGQQILGKTVKTEYGERIIDDVAGIAIDSHLNQVLGFYFTDYSLFSKQIIPFSAVHHLSPTSIKVFSTSDLLPLTNVVTDNAITIDTNLQFKRIYSSDGLLLGYLYDITFETKTGTVVWYEMIVGSNIQNRWQVQSGHIMKVTVNSIVLTDVASDFIRTKSSKTENLSDYRVVSKHPHQSQKPSLITRIQQTLKLPIS